MPKAAMDEDGYLLTYEADIRSTRCAFVVESIPTVTMRPEILPNGDLRFGTFGFVRLHHLTGDSGFGLRRRWELSSHQAI